MINHAGTHRQPWIVWRPACFLRLVRSAIGEPPELQFELQYKAVHSRSAWTSRALGPALNCLERPEVDLLIRGFLPQLAPQRAE